MVAGSQLIAHPTTESISLPVTMQGPEAAVAGLPAGTELIGNKVVSVAKPETPVAQSFHRASGPIVPSRLRIPSIGVDLPIVGVGLLSDGSMDVPDNLWTSAWLHSGAHPGETGTSVIAGHRGIGSPAAFSHLEDVRVGDRIYVSDAAGGQFVFQVTRVASLDLSAATQIEVFGPTTLRQVALITCFGKYSTSTRTYDHRLVVFSSLLPPNM